jgi:hypothetical protein
MSGKHHTLEAEIAMAGAFALNKSACFAYVLYVSPLPADQDQRHQDQPGCHAAAAWC